MDAGKFYDHVYYSQPNPSIVNNESLGKKETVDDQNGLLTWEENGLLTWEETRLLQNGEAARQPSPTDEIPEAEVPPLPFIPLVGSDERAERCGELETYNEAKPDNVDMFTMMGLPIPIGVDPETGWVETSWGTPEQSDCGHWLGRPQGGGQSECGHGSSYDSSCPFCYQKLVG